LTYLLGVSEEIHAEPLRGTSCPGLLRIWYVPDTGQKYYCLKHLSCLGLHLRLVTPYSRSGRFGDEIYLSLPSRIESRFLGRPAPRLVTIPPTPS
jgi:hypothetical protein